MTDYGMTPGALARTGRVSLVGAGPGDPDLLTVKAARLIGAARTVLYDQLVGDAVLAMLPPDAERIYVGKRSGCHAVPQDQIIAMMVALARAGRDVLRLKGGDPYVFGRGGEEAQVLAQAGIAFEVVPGISAAQGASAYAGIPLTHRDHAQAVVFATGHPKGEGDEPDWASLARAGQTVVFYMGVANLARICRQLVAHGLRADMPAAVVERATLPGQRVIKGTLLTLPAVAGAQGVKAPALIVVGSVVSLHATLACDPALVSVGQSLGAAAVPAL